jgi:Ca2+-binding EF-hand superfamily protein
MAHELTFEQIQLSKQVFDKFKDNDGDVNGEYRMRTNDLFLAMHKGLEFQMSEIELKEITSTMSLGEFIDFPTFLRIVAIKFKQEEFLKELEAAFRAFDKTGKGYLTYDELKTILTDYGPNLSIEQCDQLLKDLGKNMQEHFDYKSFVKEEL